MKRETKEEAEDALINAQVLIDFLINSLEGEDTCEHYVKRARGIKYILILERASQMGEAHTFVIE